MSWLERMDYEVRQTRLEMMSGARVEQRGYRRIAAASQPHTQETSRTPLITSESDCWRELWAQSSQNAMRQAERVEALSGRCILLTIALAGSLALAGVFAWIAFFQIIAE